MADLITSSLVPGKNFRVTTTHKSGLIRFASSTIILAWVAIPQQYSRIFRQTFHAICSCFASPIPDRIRFPFLTVVPDGRHSVTVIPNFVITRAASSVQAATPSSRTRNSRIPFTAPIPMRVVVKSIVGTSSLMNASILSSVK